LKHIKLKVPVFMKLLPPSTPEELEDVQEWEAVLE
jgi:hypothetical protein